MFQNLKRAGILVSRLSMFQLSPPNGVLSPLKEAAPPPNSAKPMLSLRWPDGVQDKQPLPQNGELTIGNIVIRRARVRYYLERIDNAFPAFLNGQNIEKACILNDGDVLQVDELQTTFQLTA